MAKAKQGTQEAEVKEEEVKELTPAQIREIEAKQKAEKRKEKAWLKEEVEHLELLAKYYNLSLVIPKLAGDFMKMQEEKAKRIEQIEKEGKKDEEEPLIIKPENKIVDLEGNELKQSK